MTDAGADPLADLRRANAELAAARRAALNVLEDAVQARDALRDRDAWLRGQRAALEAALDAAPLTESLGRLVRTAAAALGEGTRAAFYLADDEGKTLRHVVGMPAAYAELVDGSQVGPESLACGPAAHGGEPVITADVMTDPRWEDWRWLAVRFDYRGCWSFPITTAAGTPVGTLAFYWPQPRQATARELELADLLTHTAGIIIARHREAEARRQAEAALAAEKEYAESIVQTLHEPLLVLHPDLTVKGVNPVFYTHFRVNPADTIGRKVYDLGNRQWDIPALRTLLEDVLPDSNVFNDYEVTHEFMGLGRRVMLLNGRRLDHAQLILLGIRDITERKRAEDALRASEERKRAEDALRASEERLRAVAAHLPSAAVFVVTPDLRFALAAGAALGPAGFAAADLEGRPLADALPPPLADEHAANYRRALAGEPFRSEHTAHGRRYVTHGGPIRDAAGAVTAALAVSYDITELRRTEAALLASEDRLRLALDAARMGIWTWDPAADVHVRDANLNRLLGLDPAESARPLADFLDRIHPDDRAGVAAGIEAAARDGRQLAVEFRAVWPDGTVRWLRDQGGVAGDGGLLSGAVADVTDRRAVEERLRLVLASATDYAIFTTDPDRTVTSWSPGAEAVLGWAAGEILGRSADVLFTPEDRAAGAPQTEAETARRDGRAADERWHLRKDGSRFFASGVLTPLGDPSRGFVKVMRDLTDRKRTEDELRATREELERRVTERTAELAAALDALEGEMARRRDLSRRLATAQEDERRRVSRELHDSVGQLLAGLSLATKAALATTDLPPAIETRLTDVLRLADAVGKELHGLAVRLRPTALDDLGLAAALEQLVREWERRTRVPADYQATGLGAVRLPPEVETALYRVVQEALTNVARHARAAAVAITVGVGEGAATVVVEDDGEGFDPDGAGKGRLGLVGMRERLALVGGTLEVESSPGGGTTLIARVPLGGTRPRG